MNVLHVAPTMGRGGTETACLTVAREFRALGLQNFGMSVSLGGGELRNEFESVFEEVLEPTSRRSDRILAFRRAIADYKISAVVFHLFNFEHVVLSAAAKFSGVSKIIAVQGNPAPRDSLGMARLKAKLNLIGSRLLQVPVVSMTEYIETSMKELGQLPKRSTVVHNGVDVLSINADASRSRDRNEGGAIKIGMVARLDPIKDHETLLKSFSLYQGDSKNPPAVLELVGEGSLREHLEQYARKLAIEDSVTFHGSRGNIPDFLGSLDLFVMSTTREEGFGIVLIEALAAGVPIIASDVPACREVLRGGELGELIAPGDPPKLAAAISQALTVGMSAAPISVVTDFYSQSSMACKYLSLIKGSPTS